MTKAIIIIPAYNEEKNIEAVIRCLQSCNPAWDLLVVNDGSTDKTGLLASRMVRTAVIDLPLNLGIGGAVQTGFKYAQRNGYDIAVQFDGDGQHLPEEIDKLTGILESGVADVVIGSRFIEKGNGWKSTPMRRLGIMVFRFVNSALIGQRITDNTSGFRAYNRRTIEFLAGKYPTDYPEPEAVILLGKNGYRITEIPVRMVSRSGGQSSIVGLLTAYYMIKVLIAIVITSMQPKGK